MSLSDQIKQPGQIIGSGGGGGGGTTDAGDLTTGTLAAARLPGVLANVDTQAELLSAAAAAAASHTHAASDIASGTVGTARLGSGTADSTTFLRGDQTWATPSDATKLPLAGGTMTGAVSFSGSIASAGSSVRNIHGNANANDLTLNINSSGTGCLTANGNDVIRWNTGGAQILGPVYGPGADWVFRPQGDNVTLSLYGGLNSGGKLGLHGSNATAAGGVFLEPNPVSLAAAGTRTVVTSATTRSGSVTIMNTTDGKTATYDVEAGVPVRVVGDASFVLGAPGASQIGLELSSTTLRINNGYASAKLIAFIAGLA